MQTPTHIAPRSVAAVALLEQEPHTAVGEDALLHGEALLVVASGDPDHVPLELVSEGVSVNLLAHTLLIERSHLSNNYYKGLDCVSIFSTLSSSAISTSFWQPVAG